MPIFPKFELLIFDDALGLVGSCMCVSIGTKVTLDDLELL